MFNRVFLTPFLLCCGVLLLLVFYSTPCSAAEDHDFNLLRFFNYTRTFGKHYSSPQEFRQRLQNFLQSIKRIESLNAKSPSSSELAVYGLNKYSDLSPQEFRQRFLGFKPRTTLSDSAASLLSSSSLQQEPLLDEVTSFDWREHGAISAVKDQEDCGACYAFSATEEIESMWYLSTGQSVVLAPEQIVSCDRNDSGCLGGDTLSAYDYVAQAGGLVLEAEFPYVGRATACNISADRFGANIMGFHFATPTCFNKSCKHQDENQLKQSLITHGPVSVCVDAETWQDYHGGVMTSDCDSSYMELDHCAQLVGFNAQALKPYWIVRNSWNTDWGEKGYIYLQMGKNLCGIADEATIVDIR